MLLVLQVSVDCWRVKMLNYAAVCW